ncbi:hypothetical protein E4U60_006322 [Claviceps pazoutovae]|uniref:Uncharacterized protein n=1 Tax=Claviceps pazoutovae TaxID=1649127 RepID=A0A9P7M6X2_9HYPO|nr:hypothetical protein E4U60_006322 [Claviceps pazoutovae]
MCSKLALGVISLVGLYVTAQLQFLRLRIRPPLYGYSVPGGWYCARRRCPSTSSIRLPAIFVQKTPPPSRNSAALRANDYGEHQDLRRRKSGLARIHEYLSCGPEFSSLQGPVGHHVLSRDIALEEFYLHSANLLSKEKWHGFFEKDGKSLKSVQVYYTDKHFGDETITTMATHYVPPSIALED